MNRAYWTVGCRLRSGGYAFGSEYPSFAEADMAATLLSQAFGPVYEPLKVERDSDDRLVLSIDQGRAD